jgi:chromosome transmission fidelity protein 18
MASTAPVRYAVRQVLDQEYRKETMRKQSDHLSMNKAGAVSGGMKQVPETSDAAQKAMKEAAVKRDFFGRVIQEPASETGDSNVNSAVDESSKAGRKVWVTFHEGFSNAVRKPISLGELLAGL